MWRSREAKDVGSSCISAEIIGEFRPITGLHCSTEPLYSPNWRALPRLLPCLPASPRSALGDRHTFTSREYKSDAARRNGKFLAIHAADWYIRMFSGSPDLGWATNEAPKAGRERTDRVFKAFSVPSCADSRNGFSFSSRQDGVVPIGHSKVGGAVLIEGFRKGCIT